MNFPVKKTVTATLNGRIYNGVDRRVGRPIPTWEADTRPMRKTPRKPWWKKLLGL